ncbi:uncharacterized protein LOC142765739 isoform X1 [Rhipicephalus microplus]|uniref:uncharacterized protein LOC142765739 isoform X1 n=1 Tax=Rhipicephalus microplus TaxID=6941 RepID=UPI003F6C05B2
MTRNQAMHPPEVDAPRRVVNASHRTQLGRCPWFSTSPSMTCIFVYIALLLYAFFSFCITNIDATVVLAEPSLPPSRSPGPGSCSDPPLSFRADVLNEASYSQCPAPIAVQQTRPPSITETAAYLGPAPRSRPRERKIKVSQARSERIFSLPKRRVIVAKNMPEGGLGPLYWSRVGLNDLDFRKMIYEVLRRTYELSGEKRAVVTRLPHNRIEMSPGPFYGQGAIPSARRDASEDTPETRRPVFGSKEFWTSMRDLIRVRDVNLKPDEMFDFALERSPKKPLLQVAVSVPGNSVLNSLAPPIVQERVSGQQRQIDALLGLFKSLGPMSVFDYHEAHHREENGVRTDTGFLVLRCWLVTEALPYFAEGGLSKKCTHLRRVLREL